MSRFLDEYYIVRRKYKDMIYEVETGILRDLQDYTIILLQVDCRGNVQPGLTQLICREFPGWYQDYKSIFYWFLDGHSRELLGTFRAYLPNEKKKLIICSGFGLERAGKDGTEPDIDAWRKIISKVISQARNQNLRNGEKWNIHIQRNIGATGKQTENEDLLALFRVTFNEEQNVDLYIHSKPLNRF